MTSTEERRKITLTPLVNLETEDQMKVREIRNEEGIRKWMYSDHLIGVNEHLRWISNLKTDSSQIVFAVIELGRGIVGVVSASKIDHVHKRADLGHYLAQTARGGLGSAIEFWFIEFIFESLGLWKLNCEVIEGNESAVKLHKKFHFQDEGFRRSNIVKNGVRIGVHTLGLTRGDWERNRGEIRERYGHVIDKFDVKIEWKASNSQVEMKPIDQIEAARARNNVNWMSILRLALEKAPGTAKPIVAEIKEIDREISALTERLTREQ